MGVAEVESRTSDGATQPRFGTTTRAAVRSKSVRTIEEHLEEQELEEGSGSSLV